MASPVSQIRAGEDTFIAQLRSYGSRPDLLAAGSSWLEAMDEVRRVSSCIVPAVV